jgi:hypothetical protein
MLKRHCAVWGVLILCIARSASAADASPATRPAIDIDNPPKGVFADEWYALMLNGQKSGHMHSTMERVSRKGQDIVRSKIEMTIEVGRAETKVGLTCDQSSEESIAGEPLGFKNKMQLGKIPSVTTGKIEKGKVTISTMQFGMKTDTKTYDLPEGAIMTWGTYREQIKRGLTPGLKYDLSVYEPTMSPDKLTLTTMEVFEPELLDLFGRKVSAYKTKQTAHIKGGMLGGQTAVETTSWMTDAGTVLKLQMRVPPIDVPFEILACPKSAALAPNDPAELMVSTLIHVDRELDGRNAKSITYRLLSKGTDPDSAFDLPETAMQKVVQKRDGTITLELTRRSARSGKAAGRKAGHAGRAAGSADKTAKPDLEPYLQASSDLNFKDPVVADLARKAAGGEKDPSKLADRLTDFVHEYVQSKNLSVGFATASEVARSREGDCTEHGVLLAALGRAVGIPSRIVTGIVYTDEFAGEQNVFVGHLWTQFWLDGEWVDVDAAFNQTDVDPTHIALGVSAAGDSGLADLVTSGWMSLNKLGLKVLEVK